jgi:hypothetical protein
VPRLRICTPAASRGAGLLLAACLSLWRADALAQVPVAADPLAPKLQTDPRQPPRFQPVQQPGPVQFGPALTFNPAAAGAGDTGFDSSNSRKASKAKAKAKSTAKPQAVDPASERATAPGLPAPRVASPYQQPPKTSAEAAFAQAPGAPPVELGPIRQPKKRKAHTDIEDPYVPLGVQAGAFTLFPAIEFIGGYDTNPAHAAGGSGAKLYTVAPEMQVQSNWSRHEFKADLRGSYTGYSPDETPTLSRPYFNGKADARVDVTHDTRIDLGSRMLVSTDNPGSPNLQAGLAKLPVFSTYGGSVGLGQRFSRFDVSIKGDAERTVYQDSQLTDGTTASNADRQYNQYAGTLRGSYETSPGIAPFVEISADTRVHDVDVDTSGYQRDSKGLTGKIGTTFKLTHDLTGETGIGYTRRQYADPRFDTLYALVGDASLIWTANALTTVKLTVASTVGESTIPGVSGIVSRDVGLQVDQALRRWLIATVKLGFGVDKYNGVSSDPPSPAPICDCVISTPGETTPDRQDLRYSLGVGLTYKLNRTAQIKGEVRHDWGHSNVAGNDYNSTLFLLGLRLQE